MIFRSITSSLLTAAVALALTLTAPVQAQSAAQAAFRSAFIKDYLNRDITLMSDVLKLDDWQLPIVEALLEQYNDSFDKGVADVRERMNKVKDLVKEGRGEKVMDAVMDPLREWMDSKEQLRQRFVSDVKSQLSPEQQERWNRFEMAYRREKSLPAGAISGESVNLSTILRQMQLDPAIEESIEPAVSQSEVAVDNALKARDLEVQNTLDDLDKALRQSDFDETLKITERIMAKRVAVRDTIEHSAANIAAALPENLSTSFMDRYKQTAYPKAYREPILQIVFDAAKKLTDLTEEQLAGVIALESSYRAQDMLLSDRLAEVIKKEDPLAPRRKNELAERRKTRDSSGLDNDPMKDVIKSKEDLGVKTLEQLKALLTPEQFEKLPKVTFRKADKVAKSRSRMRSPAQVERAVRGQADAMRAHMPMSKNDASMRVPTNPNGRNSGGLGGGVSQANRVKNMNKAKKGELLGSGVPTDRSGAPGGAGKTGAPKPKQPHSDKPAGGGAPATPAH